MQYAPAVLPISIWYEREQAASEDCLYLNVWTPAKADKEQLPVLVYFYGGGFVAGDGSELRYDGESMARKGIVVVTVNYRLGVFGYMAHPELTKESPHHSSGNYGLMDQSAALHWVQQNIAAFGGDPAKISIAGESAGSISVSAQMASPLSKNIIAGAIGESGSLLGTLPSVPLTIAEQTGVEFTNCTTNLSILHPGTTGNFIGYSEVDKTMISDKCSFGSVVHLQFPFDKYSFREYLHRVL